MTGRTLLLTRSPCPLPPAPVLLGPQRRARWWQLYKHQQQLAMARSVVATGTTWQADEIARVGDTAGRHMY